MSSSGLSPIVQALCARLELPTPEVLGPVVGSAFTPNASTVTTTAYALFGPGDGWEGAGVGVLTKTLMPHVTAIGILLVPMLV